MSRRRKEAQVRSKLRALEALLILAVASCAGDDACPTGTASSGERCLSIVDAGADASADLGDAEGGIDAGMPDAGPCGMPCTGATPVCNEASGECVQCTASAMAACTGTTPLCDTATSECVACLTNTDCTSLTPRSAT